MAAFRMSIVIDDDEHEFSDSEISTEKFVVSMTRKCLDFGCEYFPVISLKKSCRIVRIEVRFLFDGLYCGERVLFYNNANTTNDWVNIKELGEESISSKDIAMIKCGEETFAVAMTSAEKFYTTFETDKSKLVIHYELEGKTVKAGNELALESFIASDDVCGGEFFDKYCTYMAEKYSVKLPGKIDSGWSSWSCYYHDINEENISLQSENLKSEYGDRGADLIQIDDSWQNGKSFCADWTGSTENFPHGMAALSEKLKSRNQRLGLWLAPTLIGDSSKFYAEHPDYALTEAKRCFNVTTQPIGTEYSVYTLDLENKEVIRHIKNSFKNAVEKYGSRYFKIDFTYHSLFNAEHGTHIKYKKGYSIEVYKNVTREIRKTVGDDTFLLACTAPITESIGVFDAIRTTPDVTWEKYGDSHPGYRSIIEGNAQNILLRSYYHGKLFICDPDALLVRGVMGEVDDDFHATIDEARLIASIVALSGGTILINEEIEKLDEERRAIIKNVLPPIGIAAHPEDFFEYPRCTKASLKCNGKRIAAVFNWEDSPCDKFISNRESVFAFDCWTKEFLGEFKGDIPVENMSPHSVRCILLVRNPSKTRAGMPMRGKERPLFLCDDTNFYMGINESFDIRDSVAPGSNRYFYIPHDFMTFGLPKAIGKRVYRNNIGAIYKIEGKKENE
ncbi:MAG: alpha-galactosidase [Clostridia bacterium]|nr:alpha-galactosidase [Clostridia bacterium]